MQFAPISNLFASSCKDAISAKARYQIDKKCSLYMKEWYKAQFQQSDFDATSYIQSNHFPSPDIKSYDELEMRAQRHDNKIAYNREQRNKNKKLVENIILRQQNMSEIEKSQDVLSPQESKAYTAYQSDLKRVQEWRVCDRMKKNLIQLKSVEEVEKPVVPAKK
jgi:hypothetical protein